MGQHKQLLHHKEHEGFFYKSINLRTLRVLRGRKGTPIKQYGFFVSPKKCSL